MACTRWSKSRVTQGREWFRRGAGVAEWLEGKLFNVLNDYWQGPGAASAIDTKSLLTHICNASDSSCRSATDGWTGLEVSGNHHVPECLNATPGLRSRVVSRQQSDT